MNDLDLREVSQDPFAFATKETLQRSRPEPLLVWAQDKQLNAVLLESAHMIRRAATYVRADVAQTGVNYAALDVPRGAGRPVDDEREPREVTRYLRWCREATAKLGAERLRCVVDCIIEGSECPLRLMKIALRMF